MTTVVTDKALSKSKKRNKMYRLMEKSSDITRAVVVEHLSSLGLNYPTASVTCPTTKQQRTPKPQALMQLASVFSDMPTPKKVDFS